MAKDNMISIQDSQILALEKNPREFFNEIQFNDM